jgi:hypothetical protein
MQFAVLYEELASRDMLHTSNLLCLQRISANTNNGLKSIWTGSENSNAQFFELMKPGLLVLNIPSYMLPDI